MEEVLKVKSVQDYLDKVENLQGLYSKENLNNFFYNNFRDKELAISIFKKIQENNDFKINFLKLNSILDKFVDNFSKVDIIWSNEDKSKFMFLVNKMFSMEYCEYKKFINEFLNKDTKIELHLKEFINKNKVEFFEVKNFLEENKKFFNEHVVETILKNINCDKKLKHDHIEYFFRGQSNEEYNLTPSIFRGLLNNESNIVNDTLSDRINEFKDCDTMFEKLVRMQHYGIPTRTLDITGNALSALYFACEAEDNESKYQDEYKTTNKDGAVFLFSTSKEKISYPDSDKVRILSNLSRVSNFDYCQKQPLGNSNYFELIHEECVINFYSYLYFILTGGEKKVTKFVELIEKIKEVDKLILDSDLDFSKISGDIIYLNNLVNKYAGKTLRFNIGNTYHKNTINVLSHLESKKVGNKAEIEDIRIENAKKYINNAIKATQRNSCQLCQYDINCVDKLVNIIREEKPSFESRIITADLSKWLIVRGAKNNDRIKIQDGHFIIVPNIEHIRVKPLCLTKRKFEPTSGFELISEYKDLINQEKTYYDDEAMYRVVVGSLLSDEPFIHKIVIDKKYKKDILKQLDLMGINRATVYPELMDYGKYINDKYRS